MAEELRLLRKQIEDAERGVYASSAHDELTLKAQQETYSGVQRLQEQIVASKRERDGLILEIADSDSFIRSLENKIAALKNSDVVAADIEEIRFGLCPACYARLSDVADDTCHLCKSPLGLERAQTRIAALINESGIQMQQSTLLQSERQKRASELGQRLQRLEAEWRNVSQRLASLERLPSSEATAQLRELTRKSGYLERELEDLDRKGQLATLVDEISSRKVELQKEVAQFLSENEKLRASQQKRLTAAYTLISDEVRELLRNDLKRQDSFERASRIAFSFADNEILVDEQSYFSASSRAILKASFCVGFLAAATKAAFFRHPRFCMLDILENMGVEPIRSHNFQREILGVSNSAKAEHQIIYATTTIAPELDNDKYTVGRHYTRDRRTLNIGASQ